MAKAEKSTATTSKPVEATPATAAALSRLTASEDLIVEATPTTAAALSRHAGAEVVEATRTVAALSWPDGTAAEQTNYLTRHGWLRKGLVDEMAAAFASNASALDALPIEAFEDAPMEYKMLATRWTPLGFYGRDRRGLSVCYYRVGMHDAGGVLRETSLDVYLAHAWYFALWFWFTMERESLAAGINYAGRLVVVDVSGISLGRAIGLVHAFTKQRAQYPHGEQPTPDGATAIWMVGLPWFIETLWRAVLAMLPPAEQAKVRLFGNKDAFFMEELSTRVALDQVPPCFGGTSTEPWPYGEGGDVPKGEATAIAKLVATAAATWTFWLYCSVQ